LPKVLTTPSTTCDETVEKVVLSFVSTPFTTVIMASAMPAALWLPGTRARECPLAYGRGLKLNPA
jgi:hypothetical protein